MQEECFAFKMRRRANLQNEINLRSGTILNYFSLILVKDDRMLRLTPELSNVDGVS